MGDAAAPRRSGGGGGGGGWQPRGRGRGFFRSNGSGGRFNGNQAAKGASASGSLPLLDSQGSQQVITDMLEVSQGPYSGWRLYHKQETEQRKRRSPNWGEAETQLLLRLWAERVQEMKTTKRNGFMLEEMAQMLQASGFSRSSTEVKTRIANLSQEYSGEGAESLCCDIDPGMLMGPQDTGDEEEGEENEEEEEGEEPPPQHRQQQQQPPPMMESNNHLSSPLNGLPNVPPSLTISLTPLPSQQHTTNGISTSIPPPALVRMPALIRMGQKRSSQDTAPQPLPPLLRKSVGKRPRLSLDSAMLPQTIKTEHETDLSSSGHYGSEDRLDTPWGVVMEQLRQMEQNAEMRITNLTTLMEHQIRVQKQGLKMQKRILTLLENMQPQQQQQQNPQQSSLNNNS
ncbi:hypothetical protein B566_EDAN005042 [Ephemera danica]|nr:hypothetical protein B566_EDAN005042 [Ephemera danica]